jgi:hypothetical protein
MVRNASSDDEGWEALLRAIEKSIQLLAQFYAKSG